MKNIVICLLLFTAVVFAQQKQRVAVLPSVGDLDPQRLILLTDKVREIATKNLPMENFNILKQDVITRMIGEEELYRSCKEGVCIGDLAKKTDANYGVRCDVIRLDNSLVLKFEIYSVNEESIFETFIDDDVKDFRGMFASLEARLPATFQKMVIAQNKALADARDKAIEQQRQEQQKLDLEKALADARDKAIEQQRQEQQKLDLERALADARDKAIEQQRQEQQKLEQQKLLSDRALADSRDKAEEQRQAKPEPQEKQYLKSRSLEKRIGFEVGGAILPWFYNEWEVNEMNRFSSDEYSSMGWGGYMRIDLIYVEIVPIDAFTADHFYGTVAIFAKYPIVYKAIKVSPILGFGGFGRAMDSFIGSPLGGRIDIGINEITYLRSEYLHRFLDDGWAASFKLGGGFDIGSGKTYFRIELLYNWYGEYTSYRDEYNIDKYKETIQYIDLRAGIGYKWGGSGKKPKLPDPSKQRF